MEERTIRILYDKASDAYAYLVVLQPQITIATSYSSNKRNENTNALAPASPHAITIHATGYLFHKERGGAPPPGDCSLLPAGDPTLDQIACHFEHQYVRDFKCLTKLNEWHGTHHPKSHVHVPAIGAWHYSFDKFHRNIYSTPASYTTIGARARAIRSLCCHNG